MPQDQIALDSKLALWHIVRVIEESKQMHVQDFTNEVYGIKSTVHSHTNKIVVQLWDTDANLIVGTKVYPGNAMDRALEYARELVA